MKIIHLDKANSQLRELRKHNVIIFAGSGVSIWKPTNLPSGASVTNAVWEALLLNSASGKEKTLLKVLSKKFPFEHLFERCPNPEKAKNLLIKLYDCTEYNPVHGSIAKLLETGCVSSIITTNYDHCFEAAVTSKKGLSLNLVTNEADSSGMSLGDRVLFKIHGSATPKTDSLIFTLQNEGLLPVGKRKLLKRLLEGSTVVFIGYSGLDFDLCPLIGTLKNLNLYWFGRESKPHSENAKELLKKLNGTYIWGDLRDFLSNWTGEKCRADLSTKGFTASDIEKEFSDDEIASWRISLLSSLGFPMQTLKYLGRDSLKLSKAFSLSETARSHFYQGRYRLAAKTYAALATEQLKKRNLELSSDAWLDASDSYRAGGYFIRAGVSLVKSRHVCRNFNKSKYFLKKSLIVANLLDGINAAKGPSFISKFISNQLKRNLDSCLQFSIEGQLLDFQQVGYLANKYKIELKKEIAYQPKNAEGGYKHLGFYHAEIMNFCETHLNRNFSILTEYGKTRLSGTINRFVRHCELTGQFSNLWKVLAIKKRFFEESGFSKFQDEAKLNQSMNFCEYGRLMRRLQLRRFGLNS